MADVLIIGTGPAGISAALYTTRAGLKTTILARGIGTLFQAGKVENYNGFALPIQGVELAKQGIE